MRQFGPRASHDLEEQIRREAVELYDTVPEKRAVKGEAFAMDDAEQIVIYEVDIRLPEGQRLRIAMTEASARPPFEWLTEITSDIGEPGDYFKHYLIRDTDIMLAQRKELTPIDDQEAELILHDLAIGREGLAEAN